MKWQDIKTAPKDRPILVIIAGLHPKTKTPFVPEVVEWKDGVFIPISAPDDDDDYLSDSWSDNLTHWMELPPSPLVQSTDA